MVFISAEKIKEFKTKDDMGPGVAICATSCPGKLIIIQTVKFSKMSNIELLFTCYLSL